MHINNYCVSFKGRGGSDGMTSSPLLCFLLAGTGFLSGSFGGSSGGVLSSAGVTGHSSFSADFHFFSFNGSGGIWWCSDVGNSLAALEHCLSSCFPSVDSRVCSSLKGGRGGGDISSVSSTV